MCLAASCSTKQPAGKWEQRLDRIVKHPARLFALSSTLHGFIFLLLQIGAGIGQNNPWLSVLIPLALLAFVLMGYLMQFLPRWTGQPEIQYGRYFLVFLLQFSGLLLIQAGLFSHPALTMAGSLSIASGWLLGLQSLNWVLQWSSFLRTPTLRGLRPALHSLSYAMLVSIGALLLDFPSLITLALLVAAVASSAIIAIAFYTQRQQSAESMSSS